MASIGRAIRELFGGLWPRKALPAPSVFDTAPLFANPFKISSKAPSTTDLLDAYRGVVFACASLNAQGVGGTAWGIYREIGRGRAGAGGKPTEGAEYERTENHPLGLLLEKPNDFHDSSSLFFLTVVHLDLTGLAYWRIIGEGGRPQGLTILRPDTVTPKLSADKARLESYELTTGKGRLIIPAEEIVAFRFPCPTDPYLSGLGPAQAAWQDILLHAKAIAHAGDYLDNPARGAIIKPVNEEAVLGPKEAKRLEEQFRQRFSQAQGGPFVWTHPLSIENPNLAPKDVQLTILYQYAREAIANAFGVPISLLQTKDVNRANAEAGHYQHALLAILPRVRLIQAVINARLSPLYPDAPWFEFSDPVGDDPARVDARRVSDLTNGVLSPNEARAQDGLPAVAGGDLPLVAVGRVPLDMVGSESSVAAQGDFRGYRGSAVVKARAVRSSAQWRRPPSGEPIRRYMIRVFRDQRRAILASLSKGLKAPGNLPPAPGPDAGEDAWREYLRRWNEDMAKGMAELTTQYWEEGGKHSVDPDVWNVQSPRVREAIDQSAFFATRDINKATAEMLTRTKNALIAEMTEGQNTTEMLTRAVETVFKDAEVSRSKRIAITEASRAVHDGQVMADADSGLVSGFRFLVSPDACPLCQVYDDEGEPTGVAVHPETTLAQAQEQAGSYDRTVPPIHPHCMCSMVAILAGE